ncbi:MAG TPA: STAS domain-containing protein [Candidatus Binatia bacterium]|nr:STAS domain-containing protein [Candidatus Binatia bacterium]
MALEDGVEISISRSNEVVIVGVEGRLDSTTSSRLEDELLGLIAKAEHRLILDCSRLVYISSAGLRAVLLAAKRLKNAGGMLVLCSLSAAVRKVFDLAGFASIIPVRNSVTEALLEIPGR